MNTDVEQNDDWWFVHVTNMFCSSDRESPANFNYMKMVEASEFVELILAERKIKDAISAVHIAKAVVLNRNRLLSGVVDFAIDIMRDKVSFESEVDNRLALLSTDLLNLCASFRSYLKHHYAYLVTKHGRKSPDVAAWEARLRELVAQDRAFGLIYGLRNFTHYVDMPDLSVSFRVEQASSIEVEIALSRTQLMSSSRSWGISSHLLSRYDEKIELIPLLNEWNKSFLAIIKETKLERVLPSLQSARRVLSLRGSLGVDSSGQIGFSKLPVRDQDHDFKLNIRWIPETQARDVVAMCDGG